MKKDSIQVQSLAVKYRPKYLKDLVGHEAVVSKIKGMLKKKVVPGAIMFVGETGVGKTTIGRMLSNYLNCETFNRCGECTYCKLDKSPDYEELNMSDTRGIDEIRSLIRRSKNRPRFGNLRIFFLDEVHQLTPAASNSLLKSLEEPPEHTLWILATSEPGRVLPTIMGRCMVLNLNTLTKKDISKRLKLIVKKEKLNVSDSVRKKIAELADGHVRNGVALLDSVLYYQSENPDSDDKDILKYVVKNALITIEKDTEKYALKTLLTLYQGNLQSLCKTVVNVEDKSGIEYVNKMLYMNQYYVDYLATNGVKHPNVWNTPSNMRLRKLLKAKVPDKASLKRAVCIQQSLVSLRREMQNFIVPERQLILSYLSELCK